MSWHMDDEDLGIFTNGEFSTIAIVNSATSSLSELSGIFDENYQDMFGGFDNPQTAEGRKFCFQVQTELAADLRHGDRLTIKSKNYLITSMQPKHDGKLTHIILKQDLS
ncbi:MAG: head-tail joining protein [Cyanobacteria bacterium P01_G01_bin.19]